MTQFASWPIPPITTSKVPPTIPSKYNIFGLDFTVKENVPIFVTDQINTKFDKSKVYEYLNSSFTTFKSIIKDISEGADITNKMTKLKNIHISVNDYLNGCRECEAKIIIRDEHEKEVIKKNLLVQELDNIIYNRLG